jgi:hypothetical protein
VIAVASPAVAVAALIVGKYQQTATLRQERRSDDLLVARSVLDDAAIALAAADESRRGFGSRRLFHFPPSISALSLRLTVAAIHLPNRSLVYAREAP